MVAELSTPRLRLRRWRPDDEAAIAAIGADPEVARYLNPFSGPFVGRFEAHWARHGFGVWAVERHDSPGCLGLVGVAYPGFLDAVAHRPEIGWRLAREAWGGGPATEAALAARDHVVGALRLGRLISIIHPGNRRSQRVAEKLGMRRSGHVHNPLLGMSVEIWSADE